MQIMLYILHIYIHTHIHTYICTHTKDHPPPPIKSNVILNYVVQNINKINSTQNPPLKLVVHNEVIGPYIWLPLTAVSDYLVTTCN